MLSQSVIDALPLDLAKRSQLLQGRGDLKDFNSLQVVSPIYKGGVPASAGEITSISRAEQPEYMPQRRAERQPRHHGLRNRLV